jgi:hypothetical protein
MNNQHTHTEEKQRPGYRANTAFSFVHQLNRTMLTAHVDPVPSSMFSHLKEHALQEGQRRYMARTMYLPSLNSFSYSAETLFFFCLRKKSRKSLRTLIGSPSRTETSTHPLPFLFCFLKRRHAWPDIYLFFMARSTHASNQQSHYPSSSSSSSSSSPASLSYCLGSILLAHYNLRAIPNKKDISPSLPRLRRKPNAVS